jgi:hypothetical protein
MKLSISPKKRVIVQSWGGEPVALMLHAIDTTGDIAFVGDESARRPIGIPVDQVFVFSEDMMRRLKTAYESGDPSLSESVYADAKDYCIRYQIK